MKSTRSFILYILIIAAAAAAAASQRIPLMLLLSRYRLISHSGAQTRRSNDWPLSVWYNNITEMQDHLLAK
jgi:hypothetical protein